MQLSHPHQAQRSLKRSGSCPALSKTKSRATRPQETQAIQAQFISAEGSNVWAARRPDVCQSHVDLGAGKVWQWSEAMAAQPRAVLGVTALSPLHGCKRSQPFRAFGMRAPVRQVSFGRSYSHSDLKEGSEAPKLESQGWELLAPILCESAQNAQQKDQSWTPGPVPPGPQPPGPQERPVRPESPSVPLYTRMLPTTPTPVIRSSEPSPFRRVESDAMPRARVAIVGAGPVGLWVAVLLARAHSRLFFTSSGFRIKRLPGAPHINVYERRTDESGWGSRRIVLAMSNASQDVLNSRIMSEKELCAHHCFSPTCSINLIESILRQEFEKYASSGFGALHLGHGVEDPEVLLADHDVVFVATGRSWPGEDWRRGRGFELAVGQSDEALILKFVLQPAPELAKTLQEVRSAVGRFEAPGLPMYILRPGASEEQGWLWVLGLGSDVLRRLRGVLQTCQEPKFTSFLELLTCAARRKNRSTSALRAAFTYLDKQLRPSEVSPRLTLASYWHSGEVVQCVQRAGRTGWIVLVGDAACGKPFYFGSNLNGHFQDAMALLSVPWVDWSAECAEGAHGQARPVEEPFKRYAAEYRRRIAESKGFQSVKGSSAKIAV